MQQQNEQRTSAKSALAPEKEGNSFIPSNKCHGESEGYIFTQGRKSLGYYKQTKTASVSETELHTSAKKLCYIDETSPHFLVISQLRRLKAWAAEG